jgi:hypothetical protein
MADIPIYAQPAAGTGTFTYSPQQVVPQAAILQPPPPIQFAQFAPPPVFQPSSGGAQAPFLAAAQPSTPEQSALDWMATLGASVATAGVASYFGGPYVGLVAGAAMYNYLNPPSLLNQVAPSDFGGSQ